jgi:hypothetical protein
MNLSDFFKKASLPSISKVPKRQTKSVEEFLPSLEEARDESKRDPIFFMKRVAEMRDTDQVRYKIPTTFLSMTRSPTTGEIRSTVANKVKPVNLFGNQYIIQSVIEPSPEVYNNVSSLAEIPLGADEVGYFTYMINDDGLHLARYRNSFEIGTGHENLGIGQQRISGDGVDVLIAGEVSVDRRDVRFNFQSGTFSKDLGLDDHPLYKKFLIDYVTDLFSDGGVFSVTYTDSVLFPSIFPTLEKIRRDCDNKNRIQVKYRGSDEFEDFCQNARFGDLRGAVYYFSRNPWEHVYLSEGDDLYHNPDPLNPTQFVKVESPSSRVKRGPVQRQRSSQKPYTRSRSPYSTRSRVKR